MIKLTREHLLLHHTSSNDLTRPKLIGVYISFEHNEAVSTNGHVLSFLELGGETEKPVGCDWQGFLIPSTDCKALLKLMNKNMDYITIELNIETKRAAVTHAGGEYIFNVGLDDFPDYRQIIPTKETTFKVGVTPRLLTEISKALDLQSKGHCVLEFTDDVSPIKIIKNGKLSSILMPCRI